jgi:hypothetical protein
MTNKPRGTWVRGHYRIRRPSKKALKLAEAMQCPIDTSQQLDLLSDRQQPVDITKDKSK